MSDQDGDQLFAAVDEDGDTIPDLWEAAAGSDPWSAASTPDDLDGDGIPNALDTDPDGDGIEIPDDGDSDNDGLLDLAEIATDRFNPDTDGDGVRDGTELQLGTSPLLQDTDGDGVSDLDDLAPTNNAIRFTTATIPDGDLNADNQLDPADGLLAARIVSDPGFGTPTAYHLAHGDVAPMGGAPNGINVADELLILRGAHAEAVDGDGLTSALELVHGASPFRADTDGLSDFTEPSEPGSDEDMSEPVDLKPSELLGTT